MKILIIEDDRSIRQELKQLLENALYQVETLSKFDTAADDILKINPDLILMDVNLPETSGFIICQELRKRSNIPIIFVTSRTDSMDELEGMLKGGDDYITKPFIAPVLLAHIAAVLKRTKQIKTYKDQTMYKGVELDVARGIVSYQGKNIELSKNELKILNYLFQHKEKIVPRIDLIEYLWDNQIFIDDNTLSVNITRLRSRLEEIGLKDFIETRRGLGYQI